MQKGQALFMIDLSLQKNKFKLSPTPTIIYDYALPTILVRSPAVNSIYKDRNIQVIFSCNYDRFNHFSGAIVPLSGFSRDQIYFSREDCDDRLFRMYSKISNATVDRSSSNIIIAGTEFEQHTFVIRRNGRPILCFEYICQTIREYELSFSILVQ